MKTLQSISTVFLFLLTTVFYSQGVIRTPFLELGDAPFRHSYTISGNGNGYSIHSVFSNNLDNKVNEVIKAQKADGFKKLDKASFLFAPQRTLASTYPVESGYTYRIIAVTHSKKSAFILRAIDESGQLVVPEERLERSSGGNTTDEILQLQDFVCKKTGVIQIQNGTMSTDKYDFDAVRYLIFKKKS